MARPGRLLAWGATAAILIAGAVAVTMNNGILRIGTPPAAPPAAIAEAPAAPEAATPVLPAGPGPALPEAAMPAPVEPPASPEPASPLVEVAALDTGWPPVTAPADTLPAKANFTILQIGDSHTAADFFSGRVRTILQRRYGAGGVYLPPGLPHAGIRSDDFRIEVSDGWAYESVAKGADKRRFWLTGYTAAASQAGAEIAFTASAPVRYDAIDVAFLRESGGGNAEILVDGDAAGRVSLDGPASEPIILRVLPAERTGTFRKLVIRTGSDAPVAVSGVYVDQRLSGLSYLSVGFPGATVGILNQFNDLSLADDLRRVAPDMVVLAFGTNEGFDDALDLDRYRSTFRGILRSIRETRPDVAIVVIGPPEGARESTCGEGPSACAGGRSRPADATCWRAPPSLGPVRRIQREIAEAEGAVFWDWTTALPSACEIERGGRGTPPLYANDRVHLTVDGYRASATAFARFLQPIIDQRIPPRRR